jgi:hypothetical protein
MTTRQLRIGRSMLAATHCGQQTFHSIEGQGIRANIDGFLIERRKNIFPKKHVFRAKTATFCAD